MRRSDHATELPDPSNALAVEFNLVGLYVAQISDKFRTGVCTHFLTLASRTGRHCSRRFLSESRVYWGLATAYCFFSCPALSKFT